MNNLLQSLSAQRLRVHVQDADLKRLLAAVKETRGNDNKLSDSFYDSLEGILNDLRAITIDNHDAEAFLKPVSRADYPDYYEIIRDPMDFQTMSRKVKQKQYKSKADFSDDLELIWSNCSTYNTGDQHPLRLCAKRLQQKANRLLRNITDRRDRIDPPVPSDVRPSALMVNGHTKRHSSTPTPRALVIKKSGALTPQRSETPPTNARRELSFADSPAFVRTPAKMLEFRELDHALSEIEGEGFDPAKVAGPSRLSVSERLRQIVLGDEASGESPMSDYANGDLGDKRKLIMNGDDRPRKRARSRMPSEDEAPQDLWWEASTSVDLMANGLPGIPCPSYTPPVPNLPTSKQKRRKKKRPPEVGRSEPKSLLGHINRNIRTLRQIRRTHIKLAALIAANAAEDGGTGQGGGGGGGTGLLEPPIPAFADAPPEVDIEVDDRPWVLHGTGAELSEREADECLHWMGQKVLEHAGFQSTTKSALDVLTGVATEFFSNVGRTLRLLCDKYSTQMTPEEIILHTLFESGITHVQDLERYVSDDVVRYGSRLNDLEKKLVNTYNEVSTETAMDDDNFFAEEDEEEDSELVMGNFADALGDDFLGLRELGIASELGLQSLTIPKKLLKTRNRNRNALGRKPSEPPPPYPPPPAFTPLDSSHVDSQIGLLRNFYIKRFNTHASRNAPSQPPPFITPPPQPLSALEIELAREMGNEPEPPPPSEPVRNPGAPVVVLPDDPPAPSQTKSGPLGQIVRPAASGGQKKKPKPGPAQGVGVQEGTQIPVPTHLLNGAPLYTIGQ